ncbi:MAG: hypothetical protein ACR2NZ_22050 [Rubripirellula sp.]
MLLIATDEAGYGPKLGPLVIAGTAWRLKGRPDRNSISALFAPLQEKQTCGELSVKVDDSKAVFKPTVGLAGLHAIVSASLNWCGCREANLRSLLATACDDSDSIGRSPWLTLEDNDPGWLESTATENCVSHWKSLGLSLVGVRYRVITADAFNAACSAGGNKADLLSESTLQLVRKLREEHQGSSDSVEVFCDRHGGRRYYAGVLQHCFPESMVQVISEEKHESSYRLCESSSETTVRFTVKGDSFTPVALSSLHAKYIRERLMGALNQYFAARSSTDFKPTAGYPVDADRFLDDIAPIIEKEGIDRSTLIRAR